jgi:hypothetical protein
VSDSPTDQFALGKKLGVIKDPRTFRAAELLVPTAVRVPTKHRVGGRLRSVPMFANNEYGDCVFASQGHAVVSMERSASQRELPLSDEDILAAYSAVTGFDRNNPATDNGAYELDGLNYWRRVGIGREKDQTRHQTFAFAAVDWRDLAEATMAHYVFGGLKVCAGLPLSASDQMRAGKDWEVASGSRARWGSWGGHSMYSHAYDLKRGLAVWTWGREQWMSWPWVMKYVDEVYCVISEDYIRRGGTTPQGFNRDRLDELLKAL